MQIHMRPITFQVINLQNLRMLEQARLVSMMVMMLSNEEETITLLRNL